MVYPIEFAPLDSALYIDIETAPLGEIELERYVQVVEKVKWVKYEAEVKKAVAEGKRKPNRPKLKSDNPDSRRSQAEWWR